jgi:3-hydroxyacyl-[acyl-carrier-protein] dehydratase
MLDTAAIRNQLPHGHPMVLIDRVDRLDPGMCIWASKSVTLSEPCYARLPPECPQGCYAYPASLMLESLGQAAALLWLNSILHGDLTTDVLMLAGIRGFRVHSAVYPGDVMRHEVVLDAAAAGAAFASGRTWVGQRCVATVAKLTAAIRPRSAFDLDSKDNGTINASTFSGGSYVC